MMPIRLDHPPLFSFGDPMLQHEHRSLAAALEPELRDACRGHLGDDLLVHHRPGPTPAQEPGSRPGPIQGSRPDRVCRQAPRRIPRVLLDQKASGSSTARTGNAPPPSPSRPRSVLAGGYELGGLRLRVDRDGEVQKPTTSRPPSMRIRALRDLRDLRRVPRTRPPPGRSSIPTLTPKDPDYQRRDSTRAHRAMSSQPRDGRSADRWTSRPRTGPVTTSTPSSIDGRIGTSTPGATTISTHATRCAGSRHNPEVAPRCALIDLALVAPGCWIEDALYLERLFWGHEEALSAASTPCNELAQCRASLGLPD